MLRSVLHENIGRDQFSAMEVQDVKRLEVSNHQSFYQFSDVADFFNVRNNVH